VEAVLRQSVKKAGVLQPAGAKMVPVGANFEEPAFWAAIQQITTVSAKDHTVQQAKALLADWSKLDWRSISRNKTVAQLILSAAINMLGHFAAQQMCVQSAKFLAYRLPAAPAQTSTAAAAAAAASTTVAAAVSAAAAAAVPATAAAAACAATVAAAAAAASTGADTAAMSLLRPSLDDFLCDCSDGGLCDRLPATATAYAAASSAADAAAATLKAAKTARRAVRAAARWDDDSDYGSSTDEEAGAASVQTVATSTAAVPPAPAAVTASVPLVSACTSAAESGTAAGLTGPAQTCSAAAGIAAGVEQLDTCAYSSGAEESKCGDTEPPWVRDAQKSEAAATAAHAVLANSVTAAETTAESAAVLKLVVAVGFHRSLLPGISVSIVSAGSSSSTSTAGISSDATQSARTRSRCKHEAAAVPSVATAVSSTVVNKVASASSNKRTSTAAGLDSASGTTRIGRITVPSFKLREAS
jgi:hypothetical protein